MREFFLHHIRAVFSQRLARIHLGIIWKKNHVGTSFPAKTAIALEVPWIAAQIFSGRKLRRVDVNAHNDDALCPHEWAAARDDTCAPRMQIPQCQNEADPHALAPP